MKTYSAKPKDVNRAWYLIDGSSAPLGRLSTAAAALLIGKGKPQFTKHIDVGDYVIITNAKNLIVSGNKLKDKMYYHHSGYHGGLSQRTLSYQLEKDPTKVIYQAIRGMLPVNKLRAGRLNRLKIYEGSEHAHDPQKPLEIKIGEKNGQQ